MGLADWWLARSDGDKAARFKWPLARGPSHTPQALKLRAVSNALAPVSPRNQSEENAAAPRPPRLTLRGLKTQAKDLLQQYASAVNLYPSLVHLTAPCATVKADDELVEVVEPVAEPEPVVVPTSAALRAFEEEIQSLMAKNALESRLTTDGCGGVYSLQDALAPDATPLAIFKPRDEEYMAPKNPRGYVKDGAVVGETEHPVNKGFRVGNGALRERAAYLLDEAYGNFSGVPVTSLLSLPLKNGEVKEGSVQSFVESECSAEDMGPLKFSVPEVHKVGILDVRLFNTDRHAGNILLHKTSPGNSTFEMTPIDHGFCLPSFKHLDNANFDWLSWPQAQFPFTSEELDHITSLDATRDAATLRSLNIEEECITTMRMCTALLKRGAEAGFSLHEIGSHLQRDGDFSQPSTMEKIVAKAVEKVKETVQSDETSVEFGDALVEEVERAVAAMLDEQEPKKKVRSISCFS